MKSYRNLLFCLVILISIVVLTSCSRTSSSGTTPPQVSSTSQPATNTQTSTSSHTSTGPTSSQVPMVNLPNFAELLKVVENGVVKIDTGSTVTNFFGMVIPAQGAGSGWIMQSNGLIVTDDHVIAGATSIQVTTLNGKKYPATVVGQDAATDLAVLKIDASGLSALTIGDTSNLQAGDWVLAIGNPLGEGIIATEGIISRLSVNVPYSSTMTYNDMIETTAAINPGNSGGPLINLSGQVIGINTLKVSAAGIEGMGYATNMGRAQPVIQRLSAGK